MDVDKQIAAITASVAEYVMREERIAYRAYRICPQSNELWREYTTALNRRIRTQALARQWGHGFRLEDMA